MEWQDGQIVRQAELIEQLNTQVGAQDALLSQQRERMEWQDGQIVRQTEDNLPILPLHPFALLAEKRILRPNLCVLISVPEKRCLWKKLEKHGFKGGI